MADTQDIFKQGLEQMSALTRSWLTPPGVDKVSQGRASLQQLTDFAIDLQRLYSDALQHHMDPLLKGNSEVSSHFAKLTQSRDPKDIADFQLELLGMMMEAASVRAEVWGDLADKVGHRYAEFARDLAGKLHKDGVDQKAAEPGTSKRVAAKVVG